MKECHYCHWSNTNLILIKVGLEDRWICGPCTQILANAVETTNTLALSKRLDGVEERLHKIEVMLIP